MNKGVNMEKKIKGKSKIDKQIDIDALRRAKDKARIRERVMAHGISEVLTDWEIDADRACIISYMLDEWVTLVDESENASAEYYKYFDVAG